MPNKTNTKSKLQLNKELRQIAKIFDKIIGEDSYYIDFKDKLLSSYIGYIRFDEEEKCWAFSYNYSWFYESEKERIDQIWYATELISKIRLQFPDFIMYDGHYDIFDDEYEIPAGMLFLSEIESYAKKEEIDWDIARNIMTQRIILENREGIEKEIAKC
jgi:hypothetical protein